MITRDGSRRYVTLQEVEVKEASRAPSRRRATGGGGSTPCAQGGTGGVLVALARSGTGWTSEESGETGDAVAAGRSPGGAGDRRLAWAGGRADCPGEHPMEPGPLTPAARAGPRGGAGAALPSVYDSRAGRSITKADSRWPIADSPMPEWYEEWFGEEYLQLYPHRDDADADRAVALILRSVPFTRGGGSSTWPVDPAATPGRSARRGLAASALISPPACCASHEG